MEKIYKLIMNIYQDVDYYDYDEDRVEYDGEIYNFIEALYAFFEKYKDSTKFGIDKDSCEKNVNQLNEVYEWGFKDKKEPYCMAIHGFIWLFVKLEDDLEEKVMKECIDYLEGHVESNYNIDIDFEYIKM